MVEVVGRRVWGEPTVILLNSEGLQHSQRSSAGNATPDHRAALQVHAPGMPPNSYGRPAALSAKEMQRQMLMEMMKSGEEAPPPPEPALDMRKGMGGRGAESAKVTVSAEQSRFTAESVDRYHLCGCSPFALLIGTSSAMLPPLDRDGYRKTRSDDLKEAWSALPQEEKDAYGFELELLQFLSKLVGNMDQKITDKKAAQAGTEPPQLVDDVSGFVYNPAEVRDRVGVRG